MPTPWTSEAFVQQLIASQGRLYAYILSLMGDPDQVDDVLQEVNLVLWRKREGFESGTNFIAWTFRVAFHTVQTFRARQHRSKLVFDDELLATLSREAEEHFHDIDEKRRLLRRCMNLLTQSQQNLLSRRYIGGASAKAIAKQLSRPAASIHQTLYRIRLMLIKCVEKQREEQAL